MSVDEVMRSAMELMPEERAQVADLLYGINEPDHRDIDDAWMNLAAHRAHDLESGSVRPLTREKS